MIFSRKKSSPPYYKSYSQSGEDLIIRFIFESLKILKPNYLDIGAFKPFELSNTALFYENGCTGVLVEPNPDLFIDQDLEAESLFQTFKVSLSQNRMICPVPDHFLPSVQNVETVEAAEAVRAVEVV